MPPSAGSVSAQVIRAVTRYPRAALFSGVLLIMVLSVFLPRLVMDTRPNAFLAPDNPALVYRDFVREQFGLSDPLIIAITSDEGSIFTASGLAYTQQLTDAVSRIENIDADRVISIATENNIQATPDGMDIRGFLEPLPDDDAEAEAVLQAVLGFPLLVDTLVGRNGGMTLIVAELLDELEVEATYTEVMALVESLEAPPGIVLHVAGEGAISGYLGVYIESDARRLNPLAWAIITVIILAAFRQWLPALLANGVIVASLLITLGAMAAANVPFYMITSALPVILIGISVADAIHIFAHYRALRSEHPGVPGDALLQRVMGEMWRPITLTTLTTIAGFLGLYFAAYMPPFRYFGLFAALGVAVAWLYSMVMLPAALSLAPEKHRLRGAAQGGNGSVLDRVLQGVGRFTVAFPRAILVVGAMVFVFGGFAATQLRVDENPINIFHPTEPIRIADTLINAHMAGTNPLDIVIETEVAEHLFEPEYLRRIEALQAFAETLPHVGGSTSIVDYLKQINRSLQGGDMAYYSLPGDRELIAQYFLIYSALSDPADLEEEIDYEYRTANVRLHLNSGNYSDFEPVVKALERYIADEFNAPGIQANLSGRVNLNYHWIKDLGISHFNGLGMALLLVWAVSSLLFMSALAGVFALIPVLGSVLLIYSAMVLFGLDLGVGTSMFAAVAIGLGVDYAIHTLDRLRFLYRAGLAEDAVYQDFYRTTGTALMLNFLAIACGFGVLMLSKVLSLNSFGGIVVLAVASSFLASITLLPALVKVLRPGFVVAVDGEGASAVAGLARLLAVIIGVSAVAYLAWPLKAVAEDTEGAEQVVAAVNAVEEGAHVTRNLHMHMIDKRGKARERETVSYRKYYGDELRTVLHYKSPSNVRGTGFLIWDYPEADKEDDQWLYLPALRKVRRIPASARGDYFLGTDFTYEDIKLDGKLSERDYDFELLGQPELDGVRTWHLAATPKTAGIADELGYSRNELWVDQRNTIVIKAEFWDTKGKPLKTLKVSDVRQVDGIWTRHGLEMTNHKTGHRSLFTFSEVDYKTPVKDSVFSRQTLARGR